jgi:DHA1 family multidrug resistance protein-like MFS transporter
VKNPEEAVGGTGALQALDLAGRTGAGQARLALVLPVVMFFGSFAWSFVYVSLPFHIQRISTLDEASTLRWSGWILGVTSLVTVLTAPLWGRAASRGDARRCYVVVEVLQGLAFVGMALARTLGELLVSRFILGFMGASSTFAFILVGRTAEPVRVRRQIAAIQSAMTVGQVIGPLAGAIAAARLGIRASFVLGGLVLLACAAVVQRGVRAPAAPAATTARGRPARFAEVASVSCIVLAGSVQVFFLAAVLPQILPGLGVPSADTLEVGGILLFASGVAAAAGALAAPRLGELLPERRLIVALLALSSLLLAAHAAAGSVWLYGALRFLSVLCIAPVFPIIVARVAQHAGGAAIGVINAARIAAGFVGPVVATSLLAWASPLALYLVLALAGLACLPLAALPLRADGQSS